MYEADFKMSNLWKCNKRGCKDNIIRLFSANVPHDGTSLLCSQEYIRTQIDKWFKGRIDSCLYYNRYVLLFCICILSIKSIISWFTYQYQTYIDIRLLVLFPLPVYFNLLLISQENSLMQKEIKILVFQRKIDFTERPYLQNRNQAI